MKMPGSDDGRKEGREYHTLKSRKQTIQMPNFWR